MTDKPLTYKQETNRQFKDSELLKSNQGGFLTSKQLMHRCKPIPFKPGEWKDV